MTDARPDLAVAFHAFGQAATFFPTDEFPPHLPVDAGLPITVVWLPAPGTPLPPGVDVTAVEPRTRLAVRRSEVPSLRQGALIQVPAVEGGPVQTWRVDVVDEAAADELRVLVLPVEAP